ncbi:MAG: phosphate propanoyltransferase [Oscillospiraceae bacterium]|nr:phosphate propanoyltransferase [Oscillospiraceae bacterium]
MEERAEKIVEFLEQRLLVEMEASGRHVHLSKEDALTLFGHNLTEKGPLSQPGQFVAQERVVLKGAKGTLERVAVLGPCRKESQVEISLTDGVTLGIDAPIRLSGNTKGAPQCKVLGEKGSISAPTIVAQNHLHLTPENAKLYGVKDGQHISIRTLTRRPVRFDHVVVRVHESFAPRVHLDYDEANACGFKKGDLGMMIRE